LKKQIRRDFGTDKKRKRHKKRTLLDLIAKRFSPLTMLGVRGPKGRLNININKVFPCTFLPYSIDFGL
jgi:hypothetical protein